MTNDLLFGKLLKRGVPGVVIRCLIYMYEEQTGHVRLAGEKSETFQMLDGTRHGSVTILLFLVSIWMISFKN